MWFYDTEKIGQKILGINLEDDIQVLRNQKAVRILTFL